MNDFWLSGTGVMPTGAAQDAFAPSMDIIPDGTTALASIKSFLLMEKDTVEYYEITWKITSNDFKGREVRQKIKAFDMKPEVRQRNLNMLKRIYDLLEFRPLHNGKPTDQDNIKLTGKILGIKINQWHVMRRDGSGFMEGNHVSEVHKPGPEFIPEVGVKKAPPQVTEHRSASAFNDFAPPAYNSNDVPW